ncbi:MAG: hypothetical protein KDD35_04895, partial [Bdellovibrionales bacterium]|nr:hypothetical protein [Bdellovibrionales bacterium]
MAKVILSSLIFAASLLTCAHIEKSQHRFSVAQQTPLSILQGLSWNEGALFTVLRQDSQKFTYFYTQDNSPGSSERLLIPKTYKYEDSDWVVDHFRIEFISKDPLSSLSDILIVRDQKRQVIDQRIISRPDLKKAHFKIALASCMDDRFEKEQRQIWQELLENKLDYLFLLGDNVYATSLLSPTEKMVSKSQLWQRYVETRQKLTLYHTKELIPTLAIWDDHDYGTRDGDKTYPFRQQAKEVFNAFYAQDQDIPGVFTLGPLNSALFKAFQGRFFLLDDRFQREPSGSDQGKYAHYGQEQEDWLFEGLAQSSA